MKQGQHSIRLVLLASFLLAKLAVFSQGGGASPAPYCNGGYTSGNCLQGGPTNSPNSFVNDFIDIFTTSGGLTNINNANSGCNGNANNYANYCQHYLVVNPGQVITATIQSGITFAQGFAIWVDWDQDNIFQNPGEQVAATSNVPPAATPTVLTFTVPLNAPNGTYRMRVRCAFATPGTNITPCGTFGFGETEDYVLYVGTPPATIGVPTATAAAVQHTICVGQPLQFNLATTYNGPLSYTWTGPGSYSSTLQNPVIASANATASGVYSVIVSNTSCPVSRTVSVLVVPYPQISLSVPSLTICQGGNFTASLTVVGNTANNTYNWQTAAPGVIFNPQLPVTLVMPSLLPVTQSLAIYNYSITVSPVINPACSASTVMVLTINNPFTPTINFPPPICNNTMPFQLFGSPSGGTWSISPNSSALSAGGFLSPTLAAIGNSTVFYKVSVGSCTVGSFGQIEVSKFHTAALTGSLVSKCVQDPPFYLKNLALDTATGYWTGPSVNPFNYFTFTGLATGNYVVTYTSPSAPNPTVCPTSTTLVIPVFNPPTPTISPISARCSNSPTIQLTASPTGGTWSTNSGISVAGIQTASQCPNGNSSVVYTAGQGTCVASNTSTLHVSQFIPATLTSTIPHLCVTSSPYNLIGIAQNTTGSWSGQNVSNGSFNPNGLPTGIYTVSYTTFSTPIPTLCIDNSIINVSVLNPPTASIQAVGPYCSKGTNVQMQVLPAVGQWLPTSYLSSNGVFSPTTAAIGANAVQYATGNNTCSIIQTIFVNIEAFVPAKILSSINDLCVNNPAVNLVPFTANASGSWAGTGVNGLSFNPAVSGAGLFKLVHSTASSPSGLCPDSDTLAVRVFSLNAPLITPVPEICNTGKPFQIQVSPIGGVFEGINGGALNSAGVFQPGLGVIGKNLISYSISSGPCIAYTQATINVVEFVSAAMARTPEFAYCINHEPFNLDGFVKNTGGDWQGRGLVGKNMFHPDKAKIGDKTILTYYTLPKNGNPLTCPDAATIAIYVKDLPKASIITSSLSGCAPLQVNFSSPENSKGLGVWSIDDGSKLQGFSAQHKFTKGGTYNVVYNYEDAEAPGCAVQVKLRSPIIVYAQPTANFQVPEDISMIDPQVTLLNTSTPLHDNTYMWTIQRMEQYFEVHPVVNFPEQGTYKVVLQATDVRGCKDEVVKYVEVKNDFSIYFPNSFTPNFDGLNDVFKPVLSPYGIANDAYELTVFDRWGKEVFRTTDITAGWDGSFMNRGTEIMKQDNFNYQVRFKDKEGQTYQRQGTITLMH